LRKRNQGQVQNYKFSRRKKKNGTCPFPDSKSEKGWGKSLCRPQPSLSCQGKDKNDLKKARKKTAAAQISPQLKPRWRKRTSKSGDPDSLTKEPGAIGVLDKKPKLEVALGDEQVLRFGN